MTRWPAATALMVILLAGCGPRPAETPAAPKADRPVTPMPAALAYKASPSPTLAAVKARGVVLCGVNPGLPGFAFPDARKRWRGFDVDICRALAAAVLGNAEKVRFVPVAAADRFAVLTAGKVDLLARNTSWTLARDAGLALQFPAVTYYDGQGFMVPKALGLASAEELSGARICVQSGGASEGNLTEFFNARGLRYQAVPVATEAEGRAAYEGEGCDAYSADISALAGSRSALNNPGAHVILPDVISKEALGPVVRQDDPAWGDVVGWTVHALVLAEELGLSSQTVEQARETASDPETRRLLGLEGGLGPLLGLSDDWAYQAIHQVGAYHEVFRRNLGADSGLKLERGMNALWKAPRPGLMYSPPMR